MKCQWILPPFVKDVEYARVRDINFKYAKKLKSELDENIENLMNDDCEEFYEEKKKSKIKDKSVPVPTQGDMDALFSELSECKIKPVVLSLVQPYAESYVKSSRHITTVTDFFDKKYLELSYPELLKVCMSIKLDITKENIDQVERDTIKQAKGINFFKHRAGRIGYVIVLDSMMSPISQELQELAENLVGGNLKGVRNVNVQQQQNGSDCGVFSIAFATCLVYGQNPLTVTFNISKMRSHLIRCLQSGIMDLFPTI
ncbi:hypothetical protein AWC38_SpisGene20263 [Stylophora pistillata]|uniref:Ubiquitin-like protease family profile domain-containing protein n=1 Tax=Stylophora pistillata TaxID=50429 RepID=A0A2B4RFB8_STYPI|nr:hypothetical protein AWC38_SpisGene20263 [Stylophora pistillata]